MLIKSGYNGSRFRRSTGRRPSGEDEADQDAAKDPDVSEPDLQLLKQENERHEREMTGKRKKL